MAARVVQYGPFKHTNTDGPSGAVSLSVPGESLLIASVGVVLSPTPPNDASNAPKPFDGNPWVYMTRHFSDTSGWVQWYACSLRLPTSGILDWPNSTPSSSIACVAPYYFLIADGGAGPTSFNRASDGYNPYGTSASPALTLSAANSTGSIYLIHAIKSAASTVNVTGKVAGWQGPGFAGAVFSGAVGIGPNGVAGVVPAIAISGGASGTWSGGDVEIISKSGDSSGVGIRRFSGWGTPI